MVKWNAPLALLTLALGLGACASPPSEIPGTYVSAKQFADLNCDGLEHALEENAQRASALQFQLQNKANVDATQAGIGVLVWPMFLFLEGGDGADASEYAHLKGERKALVSVVKQKKCAIDLEQTNVIAQPCTGDATDCPPALARRFPMLR